jgi:hypothetical protein
LFESVLIDIAHLTFCKILYALSCVVLHLPEEEKSRVLPKLLELMLKSPQQYNVAQTSLHILGTNSSWLSQNQQHIGPVISFIAKCMAMKNSDVAAASGKFQFLLALIVIVRCFHQICKMCSTTLASGLNDLIGFASQQSVLKVYRHRMLLFINAYRN